MSDPSRTAVLLDVDGTLVDSTYHHAVAWFRAFSRHGTPPPMWEVHRAIGMGGDKLVAHITDEETEERIGDALREAWREEYLPLREEIVALPGAADLVAEVRDHGGRVAIASSGDPQFAREAIELLGIGKHVDVLLTSDDVDASKPAPDLLQLTLDRLGDVDRAVLVGDTVYDVESARRAGLPCLAVRTGGFGQEELKTAGAVKVSASVAGLCSGAWLDHVAARAG
ncbi:HAD family hydrolase [Nocardioides hwasunensis]|uniref:HAD family hydrolase n=1 Tax=Nocardioides hwasunensis TaxID=397258 RepID=A0ABR8MIQ5_9ACTN|nr:HAD family hydrolase [Nocardioides hwasunensis]MBD3915942.1 HAD family hydrolase [Nocardioides hwasunensis]